MKKAIIGLLVFANVILAQEPDPTKSYGPQEIEEAHMTAGVAAAVEELEAFEIPPAYLLDLIDLPKLPFKIYSWPVDSLTLTRRNYLHLVEYTRIAGTLGVEIGVDDAQLTLAMQVVAQARGKLVLNESPFHRFGCDRDPTNWEHTGKDLQRIQDNISRFKGFPVEAILLDSECYKEPHPNVTARLNLVYDVIKGIMPDTPIFWYRNGDWAPNLDATKDNRTVIWYRPYNYLYTEGWLKRWQEKAPYDGYWTPWITLGSGYGWEGFGGWRWDLRLEPLHYVYLGKECKRLGGPILMYPGPYRMKCPTFHQAFVSFVKGATETWEQAPIGME